MRRLSRGGQAAAAAGPAHAASFGPVHVLLPAVLSVQEGGCLVRLASPWFSQRSCLTVWEGAFNFM